MEGGSELALLFHAFELVVVPRLVLLFFVLVLLHSFEEIDTFITACDHLLVSHGHIVQCSRLEGAFSQVLLIDLGLLLFCPVWVSLVCWLQQQFNHRHILSVAHQLLSLLVGQLIVLVTDGWFVRVSGIKIDEITTVLLVGANEADSVDVEVLEVGKDFLMVTLMEIED